MRRLLPAWFCVLGLVAAVGCGKSGPGDKASQDLKLFGHAYRIYLDNNEHPPRNLDELKTVIGKGTDPVDFERYHIIWDVDLNSIKEARTVLAYEVAAPEKGGPVLFHDGKTEHVSAAEFAKLTKAVPDKPMAERPADVTFTAAAYLAERAKLEAKMNDQYRGKVIEVKGVVNGVGRYEGNGLLKVGTGKEYEDVGCVIPTTEELWAKIAKGQEVTVKGLMAQHGASLVNGGIAHLGKSTAVTITAEQLAKETAADESGTGAKYKGKSFILTGEVDAVLNDWHGIQLKGAAGKPVECKLEYDFKMDDPRFAPGTKVKLYAEYQHGGKPLINCRLITK